jgi:hypothetical protein
MARRSAASTGTRMFIVDLRRLSAQILDPLSRRAMLQIAESYEGRARRPGRRWQEVTNRENETAG